MEKREYVLRIRTWQYMGTTRGKLSGDNYRLGYRVIAGTFQPVVPTHFLYLYIYIYRERERERERGVYTPIHNRGKAVYDLHCEFKSLPLLLYPRSN